MFTPPPGINLTPALLRVMLTCEHRWLSRFLTSLLFSLLLFPDTVTAQSFYCEFDDPPCTPAFFAQTVYVPISSTPPCSVKVTVYGNKCGLRVEILDLNVFYDDVIPPGCASRSDVHTAFSNWSAFTALAFYEVMKDMASSEPGGIPGCDTPIRYELATAVACRKPVITWTTSGGPVSVDYNLSTPWSLYESTKPTGATNPIIGLAQCGNTCCFQEVTVCLDNGSVVVSTTPLGPIDDICPTDPVNPNCRIFWCEP